MPAGNATGAHVPTDIVDALGDGPRPKVLITINGHTWRSRVAIKNGIHLIGISAANRAAAKIEAGDRIEIALALDTAPRDVREPADLVAALDRHPSVRVEFERLPYGLRRKHINEIEGAKTEATRERRIQRLIDSLAD